MTNGMLDDVIEAGDNFMLHVGMLFQEKGLVEPAEKGSKRYHLVAKRFGEGFYSQMRFTSAHNVRALNPNDAIRKWVESSIFPSNVYEVSAYENPEAERRGQKPLAILRGEE